MKFPFNGIPLWYLLVVSMFIGSCTVFQKTTLDKSEQEYYDRLVNEPSMEEMTGEDFFPTSVEELFIDSNECYMPESRIIRGKYGGLGDSKGVVKETTFVVYNSSSPGSDKHQEVQIVHDPDCQCRRK